MSEDEPASPAVYWTPARIGAGVLMAFLAVGVVAAVQWDEIERIAYGEDDTLPAGFRDAGPPPFDLDNLQVPAEQIARGGPRKDGIPSLTDPKTVPVADADFMRDDDRVVAVTVNGERRAYPLKVLNWHECYNDTLGSVPIAVVFCPLCDSVTVVDRRLGEKTFEFGISGLLHNSNVLLFDRQDDALWSQVGLIAISGPHAGESLAHLRDWEITTFADWRAAHPDSTVTSIDTGHYPADHYDVVAYESYFANDEVEFPVARTDTRFANKYPVIGVRIGEAVKAYPVDAVAAAPGGRVEDTVGGHRVVLEAASDPETVRIVEAPAESQVIHTFWFAWYAFHPTTDVYALPVN